MRFTAQEEYGLRCMLQIARRLQAEGAADRSLTIGEIAEIEGITPQYAGKLIRILRLGGLLESVRGRHGGYRLARPIDGISVGQVLAVLGGRVFQPGYCARYGGERKLCVHTVDCAIRSLWGGLQETVDRILSQIKLKDLISTEKGVSEILVPLTANVSFPPPAEAALQPVTVLAGTDGGPKEACPPGKEAHR
jgi:Rrf2 family protein